MGKVQKNKIISVGHVVLFGFAFRVLSDGAFLSKLVYDKAPFLKICSNGGQRRWLRTGEKLALSSEVVPEK